MSCAAQALWSQGTDAAECLWWAYVCMARGATVTAQIAIKIVRTLWKNMCMPKNQASCATMAHLQVQVHDNSHKAFQAPSVRGISFNVRARL